MGCGNTKRTLLSSMKRCTSLIFICGLLLYRYNGWQRGLQALTAITPSGVSNWDGSRNVTILLWYWPFSVSLSLKGDVCWDLYRIPSCRLVDQRSMFSSADVVVFHNRELVEGKQKLPLELPRPQNQRWAWMSLEAPVFNGHLQRFANIFNLTVTYRKDADICIPYGELLPQEAENSPVVDTPENKSSLVCWVVSNYRSQHKRSKVYKELNDLVPVKVYGRWTKTPLRSRDLLPTISHCYFYLAFENSLAKDYITEKLWRNAYQAGAVPIVLGASVREYKTLAPPNSFIHVDEFASVKDLVKYLQLLAEDKKRYREYFQWKQQWKVKLYTDWRERLCKICSEYNNLPQWKVYSDLQSWVYAINPSNTLH
ncbi:alpha-(1,3)-fucosyltransferase 7 [Sphaeramia orbicularis]|uniref:alpha-(1,3)-fucosyltransferase 7 n=1 Tax=Sphaeramia orbicularis TaxID=375764 RepID=UPI00117C7515|nr:alpha-(1,3)-fucosyltransferase 7-like [Sphaeramia orbicularis]